MSSNADGLRKLLGNIDAWETRKLAEQRTEAEAWGQDAAAYAQANARWTDRTGAARAQLTAVPVHPADPHDGAAIALTAWLLGRRVGLFGAAIGVAIQGLALLVIELQFAAAISR